MLMSFVKNYSDSYSVYPPSCTLKYTIFTYVMYLY